MAGRSRVVLRSLARGNAFPGRSPMLCVPPCAWRKTGMPAPTRPRYTSESSSGPTQPWEVSMSVPKARATSDFHAKTTPGKLLIRSWGPAWGPSSRWVMERHGPRQGGSWGEVCAVGSVLSCRWLVASLSLCFCSLFSVSFIRHQGLCNEL